MLKNLELSIEGVEKILNSLNEGVVITDAEGKIIFLNKAKTQMDGISLKDVMGKRITQVYPVKESESLILKTIKTGAPQLDVRQSYVINGKFVEYVLSSIPLFTGQDLVGVLVHSRDISRITNIVKENIQLQNELFKRQCNNSKLTDGQKQKKISLNTLIGKSRALRNSMEVALKASQNNAPIFLAGATGTGKDLIAKYIHNASPRRNKKMLVLNCATIPATLFETLLFGSQKGVYTGALDKDGLLVQADGGTVFLDEVNSMPLEVQVKFLRVLESNSFRRLGASKENHVDIKYICACNQPTQDILDNKTLRSDLFYRLSVNYVEIPLLRERKEDIPLLANFFHDHYCALYQKNSKGFSDAVNAAMLAHDWPGNVRQLKNSIEHGVNIIDPDATEIDMEHLPQYIDFNATQRYVSNRTTTQKYSFKKALQDFEKNYLLSCLESCNGNISQAAKTLGISRQNLQYRLRKFRCGRRERENS